MDKLLLHGSPGLCRTVALCSAVLLPSAGMAAGPGLTTGAELVQACREEQSGAAPGSNGLCEGYLIGYVDAHPEIAFSEDLPSEYMQRVLKTRAPAHPRTNLTKRAVYCLESAATLQEISASIARMEAESASSTTPSEVIEDILEQHYRCPS